MGWRNRFPSRQIPVVRSVTISASDPGSTPASRGAFSGHCSSGSAGFSQTAAPSRGSFGSGFPLLSRGVWHCAQRESPSTMYFPRETRGAEEWSAAFAVFVDFFEDVLCPMFCAETKLKRPSNSNVQPNGMATTRFAVRQMDPALYCIFIMSSAIASTSWKIDRMLCQLQLSHASDAHDNL